MMWARIATTAVIRRATLRHRGLRRALLATAAGAVLVLAGLSMDTGGAPEVVPVSQAATAPVPAEGTTPAKAMLTWTGVDGRPRRTEVDADRLEAFHNALATRLAEHRAMLADHAGQIARDEFSPVFIQLDARVPAYTEWVFNWWTSYILLTRGLVAGVDRLVRGDLPGIQPAVQETLTNYVRAEYALITQPDDMRPEITAAVKAAIRELDRDVGKICGQYGQEFRNFVLAHGGAIEAAAEPGRWAPVARDGVELSAWPSLCIPPAGLPAVPAELYERALQLDGQINSVLIRLSRPIATTAVSLSVSASGIMAFLAGFGLPVAVLGGPVLVFVVAKSVFYVADFLLSELDAAFNRRDFEAAVRQSLRRSEEDSEALLTRMLQQRLDDHFTAVQALVSPQH
ncbi:MAG TPA: hypothetical protein VD995_16160 [Azospirillum sp.]|nr:hypothetical protein [Azospirillum sp.]